MKIEQVDVNKYLVETEKAVELLHKHIEEIRTSATAKDKLDILKEILPKVDDYQQLQELEKEKVLLELEIRNANKRKPMIPEEHREKILNNREIELAAIDEKLKEQYEILNPLIQELEKTMLPLLKNIYQLESRKDISHQLDKYVEGDYCYTNLGHILKFDPFYGLSFNGKKSIPARKHVEMLQEFIKVLKQQSNFEGVVKK